MQRSLALVFFISVVPQAFGQWGHCAEELAAFSKPALRGSKWNASGWAGDRFPQADFPTVRTARLLGYGNYGRYYKARTSLGKAIWVKDFKTNTSDVLRKTDALIDLPTPEQMDRSARSVAKAEKDVLALLRESGRLPYGMRAIRTRGLVTPTVLRYAEPLRGRTVSSLLNDAALDLEFRQLLWEQFQGTLKRLAIQLEAEEIEGFGMKFFTERHSFAITICGTLWDPATDEFVIVDPFFFD